MELEECFEKGFLKHGKPDTVKMMKSLDVAARNVLQAERLREHGFHEQAVFCAYTAMFQGVRAILFMDGVLEESTDCAIEYLKLKYVKEKRLEEGHVKYLEACRMASNEILSGLDEDTGERPDVTEEDAKEAAASARSFLDAVRFLTED